jgi:glycyl-tRNA synthetase
MSLTPATLDTIVALCKRRGFVYQSAEIYGGLNGVYDFGPMGTILKQNLKQAWISSLYKATDDIVQLDGALLGSHDVWNASGHLKNFHDPLVDCTTCKHRFRADDIDLEKVCPVCGKKSWTEVRQFNMMFKTELGAAAGNTTEAYLRPETAQSVFVNFKNVYATSRVKMPFGIAQIGKAFRNEITPKQFLFRMREFEQMELEWFCKEEQTAEYFEFWCAQRLAFYESIGIKKECIRLRPHESSELSHYSRQTNDVEYQFPFGWKELEGIADRGAFDLTQHTKHSGKDLAVFDETTNSSYMPNVIECSVGVDRLFLTTLFDAYQQGIVDGEERIVLQLHPTLAPVKAAVFPLVKKQTEEAKKLYTSLKTEFSRNIQFDEGGSIGKRYRRQDEIGTPICITYDFDSQINQTVTVRDRDTMKQEVIATDKLVAYLKHHIPLSV